MPHWSIEEEHRLLDLLGSGMPLQECAQLLSRTTDAVVLKAKRLGLQIPENWRTKRQSTKSAFQVLAWVRELLVDVKTMQDVKRVRVQVDQAVQHIEKTAADGFNQNLRKA